jgi:hypothetical protein
VGEELRLPQPPASDAGPSWYAYASIVEASIMEQGAALPSLHDPIRAILCGARGSAGHLRATVGPVATPEPYETYLPIRHGFRDGLEAEETWSLAASSRRSLQEIWRKQVDVAGHHRLNGGASVLRQAMDADDVGAVFAEAAETEAVDPLTDEDIRLWMGLMPNSDGS